jgi:transposase
MDGVGLKASEQRALCKMLRSPPNTRVYRRALAVQAYSRGHSVTEIADWLQVSRQIVYRWLEQFGSRRDKVSALLDAPRSGRPPQWNSVAEAALLKLLNGTPLDHDYFATQWTVPLLQGKR